MPRPFLSFLSFLPLFIGVRGRGILGRSRGTILCQPAPSPAVLGRLDRCYELRAPPLCYYAHAALSHIILTQTGVGCTR